MTSGRVVDGRVVDGRVIAVGLCTVDVVQRVTELPRPGEKAQSLSVATAAGGPAANAAVAVAALGGAATLVTALGRHPLAALARADLAAHGVTVLDLLPDRADPPPVSAVAVRDGDGERVVVAHNAAGVRLDPTGAAIPDLVGDADALLLDGHLPDLALTAARAARRRGVPVVLDAGSWKPVLAELLPLVDVCACGAAFRVLGVPGAAESERAVHDLGVPVVLRTHGPGPVTWSAAAPEGSDSEAVPTAAASGTVPVPPTVARDTLGAGDVWHGALALGVAALRRVPAARDVPSLVAAANRVAAQRVRWPGPRAWVPHVRVSADRGSGSAVGG